jgi:hypothetical protein
VRDENLRCKADDDLIFPFSAVSHVKISIYRDCVVRFCVEGLICG